MSTEHETMTEVWAVIAVSRYYPHIFGYYSQDSEPWSRTTATIIRSFQDAVTLCLAVQKITINTNIWEAVVVKCSLQEPLFTVDTMQILDKESSNIVFRSKDSFIENLSRMSD